MNRPPYQVLILCTGNSARSIIGEYLLRAKGQGRFVVHSAGARPTGRVHPLALWVLREKYGLDASAARSKSWEEFKAVPFDLVITVCDHAREACPVWPGQPIVAHWGSPDPAHVEGTEDQKRLAFIQVASQIARRVELFCSFPDEKLRLARDVQDVGTQFPFEGEVTRAR